jgi:hypothetical protein
MLATAAVLRNGRLSCADWATQSGRRRAQKKSRVAPDCEPCADRSDGSACSHLSGSDAGGSRVNGHAPRGSHTLSRCRSMVCIATPILTFFTLPGPRSGLFYGSDGQTRCRNLADLRACDHPLRQRMTTVFRVWFELGRWGSGFLGSAAW